VRPPVSLTDSQHRAVLADGNRILLVASAGSGKTEVLTRRIIRHLEESQGQTFRILAVTFTVRAAQELQSRIGATIGSEAWRVDADTIHGFALDWLRRFGQVVNVYPDTVVFAAIEDRVELLSAFAVSLGESAGGDLRPVIQAIDDYRTLRPLDTMKTLPVSPTYGSIPFCDLYDGYLASLGASNGIDFPGMLTSFIDAAEADESFTGNFKSTYRYILVDEGQDLSPAQVAVIEHLASDETNLFVVADDRQAINGFAGGSFENARNLVGMYAYEHRLHLRHNFRCSLSVLAAAESLAEHLIDRPPKSSAAEGAPVGRTRLVSASSAAEEAEIVAEWAKAMLGNGLDPETISPGEDPTVTPEDIAIVARARWMLDPILEELRSRSIQTSVQTDTISFLETPQARIFVEGLELIAGVNAPALRRLNDELRGFGSFAEVAVGNVVESLTGSDDQELRALGNALAELDASNYSSRISDLESKLSSGCLNDFRLLESHWKTFCVTVPSHRRDIRGFSRFLQRAQQTRPTDPGVRVMTIHKVKGLEFKAVCVVGAYEGMIPDWRAKTAVAIDEERRSFYVAITRASRMLMVTHPLATVDRYGKVRHQVPSRFAAEAQLL
jgi:DNA helicase II / ATP-dependent DNA helicase PcrA